MKIEWQMKTYTGTPARIIEMIETSPWTRGMNTIKSRVKDYYGVEITATKPVAFLEELEKLGELRITQR